MPRAVVEGRFIAIRHGEPIDLIAAPDFASAEHLANAMWGPEGLWVWRAEALPGVAGQLEAARVYSAPREDAP